MREGIHPNYVEAAFKCACGNIINTKTTKGSMVMIDICSKCHPFYTGKQKSSSYGGRVEKFQKKYQSAKKTA